MIFYDTLPDSGAMSSGKRAGKMYSPGIGGHVRRATGGGGGSPKRESGERGRSMGGGV